MYMRSTCAPGWADGSDRPWPSVAYVLATSPFVRFERTPKVAGHLFSEGVGADKLLNGSYHLRIHLWALRTLPSRLAAVLLMVPVDESRPSVAQYYRHQSGLLPFPVETITAPNNSLGSYGMYFQAFFSTRGRFDLYIFTEDDILPFRGHFDSALVRMYYATFTNGTDGVLGGVMQGSVVTPRSQYSTHLESGHIMSAKAIDTVAHYALNCKLWARAKRGHNRSMGSVMFHHASHGNRRGYYYGAIQEGFGKLIERVRAPAWGWGQW